MPLGQPGPHEWGSERGAPPSEKTLLCRYWLI